jgi:hypothetical protein
MEGLNKLMVLFLVLALPLGMALDFNPQVVEVDLYSSTAQVLRQGSLNSMDQDLRVFIPRQADEDTLLISDPGAVLVQLTIETQDQKDLVRSVEAQMLWANIGKTVTLITDQYSASGTLKEVIRDKHVVLSSPAVSNGGLSVPSANDLTLEIAQITAMSLSITPDILESDDLQDLLSKNVLQIKVKPSLANRNFSLQYFVNGASWSPVYQLQIEETDDDSGHVTYWAKAVNNTDEDWNDVRLKVIAGEPNLKYSPAYRYYDEMDYMAEGMKQYAMPTAVDSQQFTGGEIGELHTYTLARTFSLAKQSKALIPLASESVPIEKKYVWQAQWSGEVEQKINLKNSTGEPFAAGWMSLYQDGTYLGGANISWLAADENRDLTLGRAKDIEVDRHQSVKETKMPGSNITDYDITLQLVNHKSKAVEVEVRDYLRADAINFTSSEAYRKDVDNAIVWMISLQPGEEKVINNSFRTIYYHDNDAIILPVHVPMVDEGMMDEGYAEQNNWFLDLFKPFLGIFGFR